MRAWSQGQAVGLLQLSMLACPWVTLRWWRFVRRKDNRQQASCLGKVCYCCLGVYCECFKEGGTSCKRAPSVTSRIPRVPSTLYFLASSVPSLSLCQNLQQSHLGDSGQRCWGNSSSVELPRAHFVFLVAVKQITRAFLPRPNIWN